MCVRSGALWCCHVLAFFCLMVVVHVRAGCADPDPKKAGMKRGVRVAFAREHEPYRRKIALVVGIDQYGNGIPQLGYAAADAKAVGRLLETNFGFEVRLLLNGQAKKEALLSAIIGLHDEMGKDDQLLFFFAGHGKSFGEGAQESGYILPQDAVEGSEDVVWSRGIPMAELVSRITKLPPKHVLIVLDTCFGGYAAMGTRGASRGNPEQLLRRLTGMPARHLLSAGKQGQVVLENQAWGHSAFVADLLAGLKDNAADRDKDGLIPVSELHAFVQGAVTRRTRGLQTPHLALLDGGQGEFVFIPKPGWKPSWTIEGVRRKALIASEEVPLFFSVYSMDAREASLLETYYLFEGEENRRIPVSSSEQSKEPDGWLEAGSFIEWNSLEVALLAPSARGKEDVHLFADRACALKAAEEKDVAKCASVPLLTASPSHGRIPLIIPLLNRWGDAYQGIVIPLQAGEESPKDFRSDPAGRLIGWVPRRRGERPLIQETVLLRRNQARIFTNLIDTLSLASKDALVEGGEFFPRKVNNTIATVTGQSADPGEPLDILLARASILPFRTTTLSFSLAEVIQWKPADFRRLNEILERKVEALRAFIFNPQNVYIFNEIDHVFIPRDLFP